MVVSRVPISHKQRLGERARLVSYQGKSIKDRLDARLEDPYQVILLHKRSLLTRTVEK
jgi:hypothetical protein